MLHGISHDSVLPKYFIRDIPQSPVYTQRLDEELDLIRLNNFEPIFLIIVNLLRNTKGILHIIRGSAAGSLVSYLLGISHLDPIKHNMAFERFMNRRRPNKPDIDCDFPHHLRDKVIQTMTQLYPNRVGRLSNHVYWKEPSAVREALRQTGGVFTPKTDAIADKLIGKFNHYSVHCGGLIVFDEKVPENQVVGFKGPCKLLKLNKEQAENQGHIKIDVLSNRGLTILHELDPHRQIHEYPEEDPEIERLLDKADMIGITYAETPVVTKVVRSIKPRNPMEISLCLAMVRPAPDKEEVHRMVTMYRKERIIPENTQFLVYDDDILKYIAQLLDTDLAEGEVIRKALAKKRPGAWETFERRLREKYPPKTINTILQKVKNIDKYAFCKSHSMNYAYLCWALLWHKAHNPDRFWAVILTHARSQYERWVYFRHAISQGYKVEMVKIPKTKPANPLKTLIWKNKGKYLYCQSSKPQASLESFFGYRSDPDKESMKAYNQLKEYGYWNGPWIHGMGISLYTSKSYGGINDIKSASGGLTDIKHTEDAPIYKTFGGSLLYVVTGLIACSRRYNTYDGLVTFVTLGIADGQYINLTINGEIGSATIAIECLASKINKFEYMCYKLVNQY